MQRLRPKSPTGKPLFLTVASSVTALDTKLSGSISSRDKKVATETADLKAAVTGVNESIAALDTKLSGLYHWGG